MTRTLLWFLLATLPLLAADRYVSTTGSDTTGNGSIGNPWRTIRYGATHLSSGDRLLIRGGTYTENSPISALTIASGTPSNPTKIVGYTGESAVWKPAAMSGTLITIGTTSIMQSNIWLEGFTIDHADAGVSSVSSVRCYRAEGVTVTNMTFQNSPALYGFLFGSMGKDTVIAGNTFSNWAFNATGASDGRHAVYINTMWGDSRIANNVFTNHHTAATTAQSFAIHIYGSGNIWSTNLVIEGNVVDSYQGTAAIGYMDGGGIRNNIFRPRRTDRYGLAFGYGGAKNVSIDNNTFYGGAASVQIRSDVGAGNKFRNNISWGNTGPYSAVVNSVPANSIEWSTNLTHRYTSDLVPITGGGNIVGITHDPDFASAPSDLTIGANSAARNAGADLSILFDDDYAGTARPQESLWDIGAYEYSAGGQLPTVSVTSTGDAYELGLIPAQFTFTRTESNVGDLDVDYTIGGTATADVDFVAFSTTVTIPNGQWTATATVTPKSVTGYQGDVTVTVTIDADPDYTLKAPTSATIAIREGDQPTTDIGAKPQEPGKTVQSMRRR